MIRVPTPQDYNDTTEVFTRKSGIRYVSDKSLIPEFVVYLLIIAIAICTVAVIVQNRDFPYAQGISKAVPQEACPIGYSGYWIDETTAECLKETR